MLTDVCLQERLDLFPTLIDGLSDNFAVSAAHNASLFSLFLRLLHQLKLPERGSTEDLGLRAKLSLDDKPQVTSFLATWLGKLLLFNTRRSGTDTCPGLSFEDCDFLELYGKDDLWLSGNLNLVETKVVSVKFLASGAFTDSERFLPALFASSDLNSRISQIGDDILKRATPSVSLEDSDLIERLYSIYLGTPGRQGTPPVRVPLQIKILGLLSRSKKATAFIPQIVQIVKFGLESSLFNDSNSSDGRRKQGLEASKLRGQVFAFTNWASRVGSPTNVRKLAPILVQELRDYIESQGWPQCQSDISRPGSAELSSRGYGYESIGLLAKASPEELLLDPSLNLLRWLFDSLGQDASGKDISISIDQALGSVIGAFEDTMLDNLEKPLTDFLLHQMTLDANQKGDATTTIVRSTRYASVRFANRCLPFSNPVARFIDVLAIGAGSDERSEVIDEGQKGLDPYWYRSFNLLKIGNIADGKGKHPQATKYNLPDWTHLVEQFFGLEDGWSILRRGRQRVLRARGVAANFCRCVLLYQALLSQEKAPGIDVDWEKNIGAMISKDDGVRRNIREFLKASLKIDSNFRSSMLSYLRATFTGLVEGAGEDASRCGDCLLEMCSLAPDSALSSLASHIPTLLDLIYSTQYPLRNLASHVFGLLASREGSSNRDIERMLDTFHAKTLSWKTAIGSETYQVHGSILAIAYWLSRKRHRLGESFSYSERDRTFIANVLNLLEECRDQLLLESAVVAIDQLSLFAALSPRQIMGPYTSTSVVEKLKEKAISGSEASIAALGKFAMQCDEDEDVLGQIIDVLFKLHEVKQAEAQFAVGSALSCLSVGWRSACLVGCSDMEGLVPSTPPRSTVLQSVLERILENCKKTKPALRQASVIWLLCLVQYCGELPEIKNQLRIIQAAFKGFLADRDSLNQESASRGLSLVYEKGDADVKDDLIRDLVGSFTGTSAGLSGTISGETELFEPGALPTGDGSITTYKDIMSLASEVGDPSLVYRFMSLASNNAIWSSRAAFSHFLSSSDSGIDRYLAQNPKLYPALFRYRFDPNTNVRNSMNDIWSALVKDPAAIIDQYFNSIMDDLLKNILGREWRVRQASCAAIADLVQGRPLEKYETYLSQIWTLTFKVGPFLSSPY